MSKFTCLVLCLVAVSISRVYAGEGDESIFREAMRPILEECAREHGVSFQELQAARGRTDGIKPCYFGCVFQKSGVFNDKGEYVVDAALQKLKEIVHDETKYARMAEIGRQCGSVNDTPVSDGAAGCERGVMLMNCFTQSRT